MLRSLDAGLETVDKSATNLEKIQQDQQKKICFNLLSEKDTLCWSFGAIQQGSCSPRKFCDFFRFGVLYVMKVQLNCDALQDQGEDEKVVLVIITFINS